MRARLALILLFAMLAACGRGAGDIAGQDGLDGSAFDVPGDDIIKEIKEVLLDLDVEPSHLDSGALDPEPELLVPDDGTSVSDPDHLGLDLEPTIRADDASEREDTGVADEDTFEQEQVYVPDMEVGVEDVIEPVADEAGDTATDLTDEGVPDAKADPGPPPPPFTCYFDSFEWDDDPGWEATGLWHRIHAGQDLVDIWASPPYNYVVLTGPATLTKPKDGKYAFWYGRDADGSYLADPAEDQTAGGGTSAVPHEGVLVSPWLDLTDMAHATLTFWSWWEIESQHPNGYDLSTVEASGDGETWTEVARLNPPVVPPGANPVLPYTVNGVGMPPSWHRRVASLDAFAGGPVRVRFRFRTGDVFFNAFRGWVLDEVSVECIAKRGSTPALPWSSR